MSHPREQSNSRQSDAGQLTDHFSHVNTGGNSLEMQSYDSTALSQHDFLSRVQSLRDNISSLAADVDGIAQLQQRSLGGPDSQVAQLLEHRVSQTQIQSTAIKDGIKDLDHDLAKSAGRTRYVKSTQLQTLKNSFKSELDRYGSIERDYQRRYRDQIARQFLIVCPNATEEEVKQATEADWGNEGVFQTSLSWSDRTGHAKSILENVRVRHSELQRIEQTLSEIAILYEELAAVVEQQEHPIQTAERNAEDTVTTMEKGIKEIDKANEHARNRRKLKWWCALIVLVILIALGLGIGIGICKLRNTC